MLEYKRAVIRTWSILGQRGTFGVVLNELAKEHPEIVGLSADLCTTSGLERFREAYPNRFINTGIAEQNLIGVAAGMAQMGDVPFATTFANFSALRACEQMRHFMGYMQENIKVVGMAAGFAMGMFGITHYGLEDIATIRAIPNIAILSPADGMATAKLIEIALKHRGPVYLRLTGVMNTPMIYKNNYDFTLGKGNILQEGKDIAIISTGSMVAQAQSVAKELEKRELTSTVIDLHTIKPLDEVLIDQICTHKLIVTIEEHSIIGGMGSAVSEYLTQKKKRPPQLIIGVEQGYKKAGNYEYCIEINGLSVDSMLEKILLKYQEVC